MKRYAIQFVLLIVLLAGCNRENANPLIIAHRGASAYAPENTIASFELARKLKADYIELDIHLTKDGEIVVIHDKDVSATTDSIGDITSFTANELKEVSAESRTENGKSTNHVPMLREVFEQFGESMRFIIELKDSNQYVNIEDKLVALLNEYNLVGMDDSGHPKIMVHSFDEAGLLAVNKLNPSIPLLKLISFDEDKKAELSDKEVDKLLTYATGIGVNYESLTASFVKKMHDKGLTVYAYTINDTDTALDMKSMGIDGIHTDEPDVLFHK